MAGPFTREDFIRLVPADKKLDPAWVKSLLERGTPEILRGADLKYIGMPVGGLCAGQLYLGGDGRLWHWDIFNRTGCTGEDGPHYAAPMTPAPVIEQGFCLRIGEKQIALDQTGFSDVSFRGEYPIGRVEYRDPGVPLAVTLEAFSPFIPLNTDDSGLPATIMQFTLANTSAATVEVALVGTMENAVLLNNRELAGPGTRRNRFVAGKGYTGLECVAEKLGSSAAAARPDIAFDDWSKETYAGWTVEGTAFGSGPAKKAVIESQLHELGYEADRLVNSHTSSGGKSNPERDVPTGKLTSRVFKMERRYIHFWICGGNYPGKTCVNLVVNGKVVQSATGHNTNRMAPVYFDVLDLAGQKAQLEIVDDQAQASWGYVGVGRIIFTDRMESLAMFDNQPDSGSMGLALLGEPAEITSGEANKPILEKLTGEIGRKLTIAAGKKAVVTFVLTWHFPNLAIPRVRDGGRHYTGKFRDAAAVAAYVAENFERLAPATRLWRDTWYDSTLPYWFLDRTFLNTSILATSTAYRFKSGRFYGWEGVGCCDGTCTSVWYYAQAVARLFPALERAAREMQDFTDGIGFDPQSGGIYTRGEFGGDFVLDGQAGNVLRVYREHQMSTDDAFLKRNWGKTRKALGWLIREDGNDDGIIEGRQSTTLDNGLWWGAMSWTSSLYLAALRAGAAMARELGDEEFAKWTLTIADAGAKNLIERLWNGEYFIHKPDRTQKKSFIIGNGCHIDQVYGQAWANQVGLGRILPAANTRSALESIWKYNFTPDVGPYRKANAPGRWYAMAGEGGVIMTTWPQGDREDPKVIEGGMAMGMGYLNECMSGFEHQVAGHMICEGLVMEGLAVERAIHDRYHASRRNPWNEVECGDHYARAMASYGVFLEACGYEFHGPKAHIGFAPRLTPEDFKCAFTAAEGWGTYRQQSGVKGQKSEIMIRWGRLRLRTIRLGVAAKPTSVTVKTGDTTIPATFVYQDGKTTVTLADAVILAAGQGLELAIN